MVSRGVFIILLLSCCSFQSDELQNLLTNLQKNLLASLRFLPGTVTEKSRLEVTPTGFIRFTQTLNSGKQSYSSMNIGKFKEMVFSGTSQSGILILTAENRDVIIQTFHDRAGDVDSMSTHLDIPLALIEPEQLNAVDYQLRRIRILLQQKQ